MTVDEYNRATAIAADNYVRTGNAYIYNATIARLGKELADTDAIYECVDCGRGPLTYSELSSAGRCAECAK